MYRRWIAAVIASAAMVFATLPGHASAAGSFKRTAVGEEARDFTLATLDGESHTLSGTLGQKATVIVFWAAWSPRSVDFLKDLQALYETRKADGFSVVAVNVEHPEWNPAEAGTIRKAGEEAKAAFPLLVDKDLSVYNDYGVVAVPSGLVLDGARKVTTLLSGYGSTNRDEMKDAVAALLDADKKKAEGDAVAEKRVRGKGLSDQYLNMAQILVQRKRFSRAIEPLEKALAEDPDYAPVYRLMAEVYTKMEKPDEAAAAVKKAEELEGAKGLTPPADGPAAKPPQEGKNGDTSRVGGEVAGRAG